MSLAGCPADDPCASALPAPLTIVLTFDDGPLAADVDLAAATTDPEHLLDPLRRILAALAAHQIPAVFFVEGPGNPVAAAEYRSVYADGMLEIHRAGHLLGYHAFRQDPAIWVQPLTPPPLARLAMSADLDQLELYLGVLLAERGESAAELLTPLFRQPYGGLGISRSAAFAVATARGWTYRGFLIDSTDWTDHPDLPPAIAARLAVGDPADRIAFVRSRLRSGVYRHRQRAVVDVLLHMNGFTADHLHLWIDELSAAAAALGRGPAWFAVPPCYRERSDPTVDLDVLFSR